MALKTVEGRSAARRSRPSYNVDLQADAYGYAAPQVGFQARTLSHRYGLTPAVAAVVAALAFPALDNWRATR